MKKIITSIILISAFLLTSCKAEPVNPEIKSENPAVLSDNNISEVKYYKAEDLKINPSEVIGIKDNFILTNSFSSASSSSISFGLTSSVPKLVHEMSYCAGVFNSDDNIFLYGCDENRKYFIDKYDTSMGSGENILDCSAMSECNYDSFSDVFINSEGIIYAYKEESDDDKTFFAFNQNGSRISVINADELPEFTYGNWFVQDIRYTENGYFNALVNTGTSNILYVFDESLDFITYTELSELVYPYKLAENDGNPVVIDSEPESDDLIFYSVNPETAQISFVNSLNKPDSTLNCYEAGKIAYIKNNDIFSFNISDSESTAILENADKNTSEIFSSDGQISTVINNDRTDILISKKSLDNSEFSAEYLLPGEDVEMIYWERLLPSGEIQLAASNGQDDSAYDFYLLNIDNNSTDKVKISYENGYVNNALICGNYYLLDFILPDDTEVLRIYDHSGVCISEQETENQEIYEMVSLSDGNAVLNMTGENNFIKKTDPENINAEAQTISVPLSNNCRIFSGNEKYDVFVLTEDTVSGADFNNGSLTPIIEFDKTNLPKDILIYNYWYQDEETSYLSTSETIYKLTVSEETENTGSENNILDIGCFDFRPDENIISLFEEKYSEYKVNLINYSTENADFQNEFDKAILTDSIPDMIYFSHDDYYYDPARHNRKNAYADLYELMANDNELSKDDLLENVLQALEYENSLYQITPRFEILTILTDSEELSGKNGWTTEEFTDYYYNHSNSVFPDSEMSVDKIASYLNPFVDYKNKTTAFTSEAFINLAKLNHIFTGDEDFRNFDSFTLSDTYLSDFNVVNNSQFAVFHGNDTFSIGFPGVKGNGSLIIPDGEFSILSGSDNKDAAWKFIKCFFTEEYQNNSSQFKFPVKKQLLEKMKEQTKYIPSEEEQGYVYGADLNGYDFEKGFIELPVPDDVILDKTMEIITGACEIQKIDPAINDIYWEVFLEYYNEDISVEEMCESLSKRVQIYLDEEY